MNAAVSALFLKTVEGKRLLCDADQASRALMQRAYASHNAETPGTILQYGWAMIRKMFTRAPNALKLWGRPKHAPPADAPGTPCIAVPKREVVAMYHTMVIVP